MQVQDIQVQNPFAMPVFAHGEHVRWIVRDIDEPETDLSDPMDHYDAMRVDIEPRAFVVSRADCLDDLIVHGFGHDDRWLTQPTSVDVTPALKQLDMQDFVDMLGEDFKDSPATRKVLDILEEQGDPRAQRLRLYEKEWSTPDEDGNRAQACLDIDRDSLLAWCEVHRPEIHDELMYRIDANQPSIYD